MSYWVGETCWKDFGEKQVGCSIFFCSFSSFIFRFYGCHFYAIWLAICWPLSVLKISWKLCHLVGNFKKKVWVKIRACYPDFGAISWASFRQNFGLILLKNFPINFANLQPLVICWFWAKMVIFKLGKEPNFRVVDGGKFFSLSLEFRWLFLAQVIKAILRASQPWKSKEFLAYYLLIGECSSTYLLVLDLTLLNCLTMTWPCEGKSVLYHARIPWIELLPYWTWLIDITCTCDNLCLTCSSTEHWLIDLIVTCHLWGHREPIDQSVGSTQQKGVWSGKLTNIGNWTWTWKVYSSITNWIAWHTGLV